MENLRLSAVRFHLWMTTSVPVPRSVLVFGFLFVFSMFVTVCMVSKMAQMMPKPVKVCPSTNTAVYL